jgi:hypothetical protein
VKAVATLPSGGHPDVVMVNQGLWELARHDRNQENAGFDDPDPPIITDEFVEEFTIKAVDFLSRLRSLFGNETRLKWRQMHQLTVPSGPWYNTKDGTQKKNRQRFHPVKINMLNKATEYALKIATKKEVERREELGIDTTGSTVSMFRVGDIIRGWPDNMWMQDDVHPGINASATIWGEGLLEYLSRTPIRLDKPPVQSVS